MGNERPYHPYQVVALLWKVENVQHHGLSLIHIYQLAAVLDELRRMEAGGINDELLDVIEMIAAIMDGMKEENAYGE